MGEASSCRSVLLMELCCPLLGLGDAVVCDLRAATCASDSELCSGIELESRGLCCTVQSDKYACVCLFFVSFSIFLPPSLSLSDKHARVCLLLLSLSLSLSLSLAVCLSVRKVCVCMPLFLLCPFPSFSTFGTCTCVISRLINDSPLYVR